MKFLNNADCSISSKNGSERRQQKLGILKNNYLEYMRNHEGLFVSQFQSVFNVISKKNENIGFKMNEMAGIVNKQQYYFQDINYESFNTLVIEIINTLVTKEDHQTSESLNKLMSRPNVEKEYIYVTHIESTQNCCEYKLRG